MYKKDRLNFLLVSLTIGLLLVLWYIQAIHADLQMAMDGFSPADWLNYKHANVFSKSFPLPYTEYDKSFFMYIYLLFEKIGINITVSNQMVILINIILIALAYLHLAKTLCKEIGTPLLCLLVLLAVGSYSADVDMARIGVVNLGLYYDFADAARLFALSFFLRRQYILSAVFLALSFITHPEMAFAAVLFIFAAHVSRGFPIKDKKIWIAVLTLMIVCLSWLFLVYSLKEVSGGEIPFDKWIQLMKLTNFHWFPASLEVFSARYGRPLLPYVCFNILLIYSFTKLKAFEYRKELKYGFIFLNAVLIVGLVLSCLSVSPFLIKLALHRVSSMVLRVGLICIAMKLYDKFNQGTFLESAASLSILIIPFISIVPYPLISDVFLLFLLGPVFFQHQQGKLETLTLILAILLLLGAGLYICYGYGDGLGHTFLTYRSDAYSGGEEAICFYVTIFLAQGLRLFNLKQIYYALLICLTALASVAWGLQQRMHQQSILQAQEYKDVQLWAKQNTGKNAVFMVDPSIFYGWLAYSDRPFIGNSRFWLMGWLYNSDFNAYVKGLALVKDMNVNLWGFLQKNTPSTSSGTTLYELIDENYYHLGDNWRCNMVKKYGIAYFVLDNTKIINDSLLAIAYKNSGYTVLDAASYCKNSH